MKATHIRSRRRDAEHARILTPAELSRAVARCDLTRDVERNRLVIIATHALGLRISELAQAHLSAFLLPTGMIQSELYLRPAWTKFNRARRVPISSKPLRDAIDAYLEHRIRKGLGVVPGATEYRGLASDLPMVLSERGTAFNMAPKKRKMADGRIEVYRAADGLTNWLNAYYASIGLHGASSHSGRRSFCSKLLADGVDVEIIAQLVGYAEIDHTYTYLDITNEAICQAFEAAL